MPVNVTIAPSQKADGAISPSESFYLIQFAREIAGICPNSNVTVRYGREAIEQLNISPSQAEEDNILLF